MKDPLPPAKATTHIRKIAIGPCDFYWTAHAREQMADRDLTISDVLHVLKYGFVYEEGQPATKEGFFKYGVESTSPNSGGRVVRIIVIPSTANGLKVVTVMWKDEA